MRNATRRAVLIGAASGLAVSARSVGAATIMRDDMILGRPDAPVTLIEYASPISSYCAEWHFEVFPRIRERYIKTGRVRLVLKEFVTPPAVVAEDCFLLCRAAGPSRYFPILDSIYDAWEPLVRSGEFGDVEGPREILLKIAQAHGVGEKDFAEALSDAAAREALNARVHRHSEGDGVSGAPTFVINDRLFEGAKTFDVLVSAIEIEEAERSASKAT